VFIKDPCSSSTFDLVQGAPIDISMILYYLTTETKTQAVKIWTDVEEAYPHIICPITAVLTPTLPYISLSADFTTILVDGSFASDPDNGLHTMTLTVDSLVFPSLVTTAVYTFVLDLQACVVNDFVFAQQIASFTYMLTDAQVTTPAFLATQSNLNCLFPITYAVAYSKNGIPIAEPTAIPFNPVANTFSVFTWNKLDPGLYSIVVSASIPQILLPGGTLTITFTFDVTIESDCKLSVINDRVINNMTAEIWVHEL
jgi:hypothetical protein